MARLPRPDTLARLILGGIFIYASLDKILQPEAFAEMIYNYQLLPARLINLLAVILPWVELILGALLLLGRALPGAVALANLLLLIFFGALMFNLARGLNVHCGCFTVNPTGDPATWWYVFRDAVFLMVGAYLWWKTFRRADEATPSG